jgi:hypothetical protein
MSTLITNSLSPPKILQFLLSAHGSLGGLDSAIQGFENVEIFLDCQDKVLWRLV